MEDKESRSVTRKYLIGVLDWKGCLSTLFWAWYELIRQIRRDTHQFPGWLIKHTAREIPIYVFCNDFCVPFSTPYLSFLVCCRNFISLPLLGTFQGLFPSPKTQAIYIKYHIKLCVGYLVMCIAWPQWDPIWPLCWQYKSLSWVSCHCCLSDHCFTPFLRKYPTQLQISQQI